MRSALGKGLDALISDETAATVAAPVATGLVTELPIDRIHPNPRQPRQAYSAAALKELADSIAQRGVLQPILVTPASNGTYEIIAGERRWRAAKQAGLNSLPAVVKPATDVERFQMALIENIQREDLNPLEQARGYERLAGEFQMTQEEIAVIIGKDRTVIANMLRLLNLPADMQAALSEGKISASHARSLAALDDAAARQTLFQRILDENLSVRSVEKAVREQKQVPVRAHLRAAKAPEVKAVEEELQQALTRKVELQALGPSAKKGWLKLEYYSIDDLNHLINQLKRVSQPS